MITLKEWMEVVDYRITEGSGYGWQCYGHDAYCLDSWNGDQDGHSLSITFDQKTQVVYEVQIHDYLHNRAYRMINPDYVEAHTAEAGRRGSDSEEAWENVNYIDLDVDDDWIQKALAVVAGEPYDTRVSVTIDLCDADMLALMKMAHDRDITFNQLVEEVLKAAIKAHNVKDLELDHGQDLD
jgi:hypothetical protein